MQYYEFIASRGDTGAVLPLAKITVFLAGTTTLASIYDSVGAGLANPTTAATSGLVGFAATNGAYDVQIASADGSYLAPKVHDLQLYDLTQLDAKVASVTAATTAPGFLAIAADLALGAGSKIGTVAADLLSGASNIAVVAADLAMGAASLIRKAATNVVAAPAFITTSRVLTAADSGKSVLANIPGPVTDTLATIIVPSNSVDPLPIGTMYEIVRTAGSALRFASDSAGAAVIVGPASGQTIVGDNAWCRLLKEGADQWRLYGVLGNAPATAIAPKVWFDASDLSSMKQERTGASATTAAAVGQPVGSWRNKGSLGGWAVTDADAKRPILQQRGAFYEVVFDGVDDLLRLPAPALNLASIEIYIGVRFAGTIQASSGVLSLAPAVGNDYNQPTGMAFYLSANGTQYNWVGDGNGAAGSTMIVSAAGVMTKRAHTAELRKIVANAATMTLDGNNGNGQVNNSTATTAFGVQGGDLLLGVRQGNGVNSWGNVAITSIVITNEPVADPSSIRTYEEAKTYGTVPVYPSTADTTQLSAARNTLISELFAAAGGAIPTALATMAVESPNPLNGVVTFTNLAQCEKMTIPGYAARPRLWTPTSPRNDVIFLVCAGHDAGWSANGIPAFVMQPLLTANVRICTFVLPGGPNDYTSGGPTQHESGLYTLADWVGPVCIAINKLKNDFPSAAIYMTGISGGGWMTTISAACDARIAKSYQFVGTLPDMIYINRDFEQRLDGLTADYLTLYMLAACPGRRHMQVLYENDPVAFNRADFNTRPDYSVQMAAKAAAIGGGDYDLNWVNYNQHAYQSAFSTLVISELP